MPDVIYIAHDGTKTTLDVEPGNSVMMAAVFDGLDGIEGMCGGCLSGASCHVYVDPAWVEKIPAASEDEIIMLEQTTAERRPNSRLSCQIEMTSEMAGLTVQMPESQS